MPTENRTAINLWSRRRLGPSQRPSKLLTQGAPLGLPSIRLSDLGDRRSFKCIRGLGTNLRGRDELAAHQGSLQLPVHQRASALAVSLFGRGRLVLLAGPGENVRGTSNLGRRRHSRGEGAAAPAVPVAVPRVHRTTPGSPRAEGLPQGRRRGGAVLAADALAEQAERLFERRGPRDGVAVLVLVPLEPPGPQDIQVRAALHRGRAMLARLAGADPLHNAESFQPADGRPPGRGRAALERVGVGGRQPQRHPASHQHQLQQGHDVQRHARAAPLAAQDFPQQRRHGWLPSQAVQVGHPDTPGVHLALHRLVSLRQAAVAALGHPAPRLPELAVAHSPQLGVELGRVRERLVLAPRALVLPRQQ